MPEGTTKDYVAVIDIGSNAVRLVVYDGLNRAPFKIHNERTQCHLGKHLATTGRLNPEGVTAAIDSIGRYAGLIKTMKIKRVRAVATAAMRDAADGADFIKKVKDNFGLEINVIEGEEEARLSAQGVMMNGLGAQGVIGDYGGGSLELIVIENDVVRHKASLPLGAHRLHALATREERIRSIDRHLETVSFLKDFTGRDFYAIGGAWRSMARGHMTMTKHPLHVLDQYTIDGKAASDFAELISRQSVEELESFGMMEKRLHDMGVAALAMHQVFGVLKPARLIFSGTGLREGMLYDSLDEKVQAEDALISSCRKVAQHVSRFGDLDAFDRLAQWMAPLFAGEDATTRRLLQAGSLLSDIGWFEHEDYQARLAFERILVMPFYGVDHAARAFLSLMQYARYSGGDDMEQVLDVTTRILKPKQSAAAIVAGLAQRLGYLLTAGALELLKDSGFEVSDSKVTLKLDKRAYDLNSDMIETALQRLAQAMGKEAAIRS